MVNFFSIFCPDLQNQLKPIYDLTRKGRQFVWGKEQQDTFEEIKHRLQKPPVLHMPEEIGRFQLYSDTSKYARGSALYQIQKGKPKLIVYMSKRLPEAAHNYFITELKMCGLAIDIASFAHLLRKVDFDEVVDHLVITQTMRSKVELATNRIKRLLEVLSAYSFNLYYIKGKDMILSDFLSRQNTSDKDTREIIPISFNMMLVLQDKYYNIDEDREKYMVQTRSQTKASGVQLPKVHGSRERLDPHKIPEKQPQPIVRLDVENKPRLDQGRAGVRRKALNPLYPRSGTSDCRPIIISNGTEPIMPKPIIEIPRSEILLLYLVPQSRPPPKLPDQLPKRQEVDRLKIEIEENLPFQENIISKVYERPDKSYFQESIELKDLIDTNNIIQQFLLKQTDIDKILEITRKKVLKGTHLPLKIKEIQAGYLNSSYFKDIYLYLAQNTLLSKKAAIKRVEVLAEKYVILDSLLFKLMTIPGKETALLAIPETCADKIITLYLSNLFVGHQGVIKTFLTISDRFYIPNLMHY